MSSGMPIMVDPMATADVVYESVPGPSNSTNANIIGGTAAAGLHHRYNHQQQQTQDTNAKQQQEQQDDSASENIPLPPGMEIILGNKKYTVQYLSYEMSREKATEYIHQCTGTPFTRMSSPSFPRQRQDQEQHDAKEDSDGPERMETHNDAIMDIYPGTSLVAEAQPVLVTTATPVAAAASREQFATHTPADDSTTHTRGENRGREGSLTPAPLGEIESLEAQHRHRSRNNNNDIYKLAEAASGLPPPPTSQRDEMPQQQNQPLQYQPQHATGNPNERGVDTTNYLHILPPPPQPAQETMGQSQKLGYFWEDGVWKVWEATTDDSTNAAVDGNVSKTLTGGPRIEPPKQYLPQPQQQRQQQSYPTQAQQQQQQQQSYPTQAQQQQQQHSYPVPVHQPPQTIQYQYPLHHQYQYSYPPPQQLIVATTAGNTTVVEPSAAAQMQPPTQPQHVYVYQTPTVGPSQGHNPHQYLAPPSILLRSGQGNMRPNSRDHPGTTPRYMR